MAIQANGSAVAGGSHFLSTSVFGLARVNASGSLDTTFGNAGTLTTSIQGGDSAGALVIQPALWPRAFGLSPPECQR